MDFWVTYTTMLEGDLKLFIFKKFTSFSEDFALNLVLFKKKK